MVLLNCFADSYTVIKGSRFSMKWDDIQEMPCSVARALSIVGDRWTLLILRDCFMGTKRFDTFQKQIGLSRHRLTDRLNKLVEHKILNKTPYQEKPLRHEYQLTKKGVDLYPILMTLAKWGDTWMADEAGSPIEYLHTPCGHITSVQLCCSVCGDAIKPNEIKPKAGPGLKAYATKAKSQP
ncbi:winged helix-turn-helix transcriptional regulator [Alkalimarinus sediminis]|uniref:Helix-turn-helix transcriptional regulator n=1 Tax=Alkalimarinus sediminis TaxID=1632866 RepID=A0A9E8KIZ5_9ALTE|nr:helix-turn-helix domain-containing protein [Alkalimarinus sediminis]UZW74451.1 helix-turn-helix transcriptional regulator [Alkalimarinus sediminis]